MKNLLLLVLLVVAVPVVASDPVDIVTTPKADYGYTYGTLAVSSTTVVTLAADSTNAWREIRVIEPGTSGAVYYKVGSTITLATDGSAFLGSTGRVLQTNKAVSFLMPSGQAAITLRYEIRRRR